MEYRSWKPIIAEARRIALSYQTNVTLRQLHYRLVASGVGGYINTDTCYKRLSSLTSDARRDGVFPALSDLTRGVNRPFSFKEPNDALEWLTQVYHRDRTEGQKFQTWVLYEKATLTAQVQSWTEDYGVPIAALRGYSSESLEREVFQSLIEDGRPAVVFYVGDLDPEGEDIERNFLAQAARQGIEFGLENENWTRLTVLPTQVGPMGLVPNPGKTGSSRAKGFIAKYGELFQIEVEAVDPAVLQQMVSDAVTARGWFNKAQWMRSKAQEEQDIEALGEIEI